LDSVAQPNCSSAAAASLDAARKTAFILNYCGVHPVARVSSNVNIPPYATMFGARFYCALTLHVSAPIGGHLQVRCDKIYSKVATFMSTDPLTRHI
jgi:hypothetical protein